MAIECADAKVSTLRDLSHLHVESALGKNSQRNLDNTCPVGDGISTLDRQFRLLHFIPPFLHAEATQAAPGSRRSRRWRLRSTAVSSQASVSPSHWWRS